MSSCTISSHPHLKEFSLSGLEGRALDLGLVFLETAHSILRVLPERDAAAALEKLLESREIALSALA